MGGGANAHGELIDDPVEDEMQADGDPSSVSVAQEPLNVKSQEYRRIPGCRETWRVGEGAARAMRSSS